MDPSPGAGFGAHTIIGNSDLADVYSHELHHLWQSRSMGDMFILNYLLHGFNAMLNLDFPIDRSNFFEAQAYEHHWFKY
jgi:hypothetical protein